MLAVAAAPALCGWFFFGGAVLEAVGAVGYAIALGLMFARSDRRRVGGYAVLLGGAAAVVQVAPGVDFAVWRPSGALDDVHARFSLLGFPGLTVVGVTYHFYPPGACSSRWLGWPASSSPRCSWAGSVSSPGRSAIPT